MDRYPVPSTTVQVEETIRRSRFVTTVARVSTRTEAREVVRSVRARIPGATHYCWAFNAGAPGSSARIGMSDDGEPHGTAGRPMLEVLRQDYVRTARAKGLRESVVIIRHALRNALLPVLTVMGVTIATIIGSQVILENMFNIPGIGNKVLTSLFARDNPVFQSVVLIIAVFTVLTNLVVDILYGVIDPRIRLS